MGEDFLGVEVVSGSRIKWGVLTTSALGGLGAAWGTGMTETVTAFGAGAVGAVDGLRQWATTVVATPFNGFTRAISAAWGNSVAGSGVFGRGGRALIPLPGRSFAQALGDLGVLAFPVALAGGLFVLGVIIGVLNRV